MPRDSLRSAINRFCKECLFDPREPGGWREQIRDCTASDCPLWKVRPKPKGVSQDPVTGPLSPEEEPK